MDWENRAILRGSLNEFAALVAAFKTFRQLTGEWIGFSNPARPIRPIEAGSHQKIKAGPPGQHPGNGQHPDQPGRKRVSFPDAKVRERWDVLGLPSTQHAQLERDDRISSRSTAAKPRSQLRHSAGRGKDPHRLFIAQWNHGPAVSRCQRPVKTSQSGSNENELRLFAPLGPRV
jgi:hypothetical protein